MRRRQGLAGGTRRHGSNVINAVVFIFTLASAPMSINAAEPAPSPNRPLHLIVPFTAGNQLDVFARLIGNRLAELAGQPVIVENRPGASGNAASVAVARAPADGYTLLVSGVLITLLPHTYGSRAVDPVASFAPITRLAQQPIVIVANGSQNINSLSDLIELARRQPGKIAYATSGIGTAQHIAMTMLAQRAGIDLYHVPYSNSGEIIRDSLTGAVPIAISFPGTVEPYLRTGQLKALAVTSAHRAITLPDVPTVAESGFPGFDVQSWAGVLAPAGTPAEIIAWLHREICRALNTAEVYNAFLGQGAEPVCNTPEQFAAEIQASVARWAPVVKAAGIKVD